MCDDVPDREWRDARMAEGVLAQRLGVTINEAARGLHDYVHRGGAPLGETARAIVEFRLLIDRRYCRPPGEPGPRA